MIQDWPQDIEVNLVLVLKTCQFLPIMFEMTDFFAAHLMVITLHEKLCHLQAENLMLELQMIILMEVAVNEELIFFPKYRS
jgi:hypothetical protein